MTWLLVPLICLGPCALLRLPRLIYDGGRPLEMMKTTTDTSLEILKRHFMESNYSVFPIALHSWGKSDVYNSRISN